MLRALLGYAVLAIIGIFVLKFLFALVGIAFHLLWVLLWFAFLGFIFYLILKVVSPATAKKIRDRIRGEGA